MSFAGDRIEITIARSVAGAAKLGALAGGPVRVAESSDAFRTMLAAHNDATAAALAGRAPAEIEGLAEARRLYRAFGIDPTRKRPSSEALLRRVILGKPFPRVNNAVDLGNFCSLAFLLPLGLYDAGKIRGPVTFRRGQAGESYPGIRKSEVHLDGRPLLADADGPFGNPTSDSLRTSVTRDTRELLLVLFCSDDFDPVTLREHLGRAAEWMQRFVAQPDAGFRSRRWTVPG